MILATLSRPWMRPAVAEAVGDWQLAAGHFEPAAIPLEIIAPQPSLNTDSPYYRAYPGIAWEMPVGVLGGAWPYKVELIQGPEGMIIGETLDHAEFSATGLQGTNNQYYSVLRWSNPTTSGSPHTIEILVTDQSGNTDSVTWTLTVTTSNTLFVDAASGNNSNDGTIGSPKLNLSGVYGATKGDTTYNGYHVYFRAGTYEHDILPIEDTVRVTWTASKAHVLKAYPGEAVVIDVANAHFNWEGGNDISLIGINFQGLNEAGGYKVLQFGANPRTLVYNCVFDSLGAGGPGGSNSAVVFFANGSTTQHAFFRNITIDAQSMALIESYATLDKVMEGITVTNYTGSNLNGLYEKINNANVSVRAVRMIDNVDGYMAVVDTYAANGAMEYKHCLWKGTSGDEMFQFGRESVNNIEVYVQRNTQISGSINHDDASGTITYANNVRQHDGTDADGITHSGGTEATTSGTGTDLVGTSGIVNTTTGQLTGSYIDTNLGLDGFEIA